MFAFENNNWTSTDTACGRSCFQAHLISSGAVTEMQNPGRPVYYSRPK